MQVYPAYRRRVHGRRLRPRGRARRQLRSPVPLRHLRATARARVPRSAGGGQPLRAARPVRPRAAAGHRTSSSPRSTHGDNRDRHCDRRPAAGTVGPAVVTQRRRSRGRSSGSRSSTAFGLVSVDDIGFSPVPQPDTAITGGPANPTTSTDATFTFAGNQDAPDVHLQARRADLRGVHEPEVLLRARRSARTRSRSRRVDRWGTQETTRATRTWTINPPAAPVADRDLDGVLDATDNCPDAANAGQGDVDGDAIGDACEIFKSGASPIEAGREVDRSGGLGRCLHQAPGRRLGRARSPRGCACRSRRAGSCRSRASPPCRSGRSSTRGRARSR